MNDYNFLYLVHSGGAKVKPEDAHMQFGVYVLYNAGGYGENFMLNA